MKTVLGRSLSVTAAAGLALALLGARPALGQDEARWSRLLGPNGEPTAPDVSRPTSGFALFGSADYGRVDMNLSNPNVSMCWENRLGDWPETFICPYGFMPAAAAGASLAFRTMGYHYGVPPSEWNKARALVPSLGNARGGGYNVFSSYTEVPVVAPTPMDGSLGPVQSGITSVNDGSCRDQSPWGAGRPLLPAINCPESWGSGGPIASWGNAIHDHPAGWAGGRIVDEEEYLAAYEADKAGFTFDFWRMPDAWASGTVPNDPLGAFQTYGYESDWSEEKRAAYGSVLPGGDGDPTQPGWPLGIVVRTDAFTVPIPALSNVMFTQTLVINRSEDVYNVGLDYDSLYFSLAATFWWHSNIQNASYYFEPWSGAVKSVTVGVDPTCNGGNNPVDIPCTPITIPDLDGGFRKNKWGGAYVILKSPIGDLRNKLFSNINSLFYDDTHPLRGDTITFNIAAPCGFRACSRTVWRAIAEPDWQRRMFGLLSGITSHAAGNRPLTGMSDRDYWHIFRSYTFPNRADDPTDQFRRDQGFNTHIPGVDPVTRIIDKMPVGPAATWDWNKDGQPDTLFYSTCNPDGCVETWADTLAGPLGSGPYVNAYGNVGAVVSAGPFRLAAGDTTSWVMAWLVGPSQADVEKFVGNATAHYLNLYAAPQPVPPPSIRSVTVTPGDPQTIGLRLFFGDEPEEFVDPFLLKRGTQLKTEQIGIDNPWLPDTILFLAENNLQAVHLFKSCDGGSSFTADDDCEGDPAAGGIFGDIGWLPLRTFDVDELGSIPNVFEDRDVQPGRTYLYVLISESRGAEPLVGRADGRAEVFAVAPKLLNALSVSPGDANVVRVYMPTSLQAGAEQAAPQLVSQSGPTPVPPEGFHRLDLIAGGDELAEATWRVVFGQPVVVTDSIFGDPAEPNRVSSVVQVTNSETADVTVYTGARLEGVTTAGGSTSEVEPAPDVLVRTTTLSGMTGVLLRTDAGDEPWLATSDLSGDAATPGAFITRSDWPLLLLSVEDLPGDFNTEFFESAFGDTLAVVAQPSIVWGVGTANPTGATFGDYVFEWADQAFGPGAPFQLDFFAPENTEGAIANSVAARAAPQQTLPADDATLALAKDALTNLGQTFRSDQLTTAGIVQASLPFTIRNRHAVGQARTVDAIMLRRPRNTRLLGAGRDTLRVAVPDNAWLPGDTLIFVETVETDPEVTWNRTVLGCFQAAQFTRLTCNPVVGQGQTLFLSARAGQKHHVQYFNAFNSLSIYDFSTAPARAGLAISPDDIRGGMDQINVVPNPYIVNALTDQADVSTILFTHLPPRGEIRIFTVSGQWVQTLKWDESDLEPGVPGGLAQAGLGAQTAAQGDLRFNLRTREGNVMASGLYIFHVVAKDANGNQIAEKLGKFVIIR